MVATTWIALALVGALGVAAVATAASDASAKGRQTAAEKSGRTIPSAPPADVPRNDTAPNGEKPADVPRNDSAPNSENADEHAADAHDDASDTPDAAGASSSEEGKPGDFNENRGKGLANSLEHVPEAVAEKLSAIERWFAEGLHGFGKMIQDLFGDDSEDSSES